MKKRDTVRKILKLITNDIFKPKHQSRFNFCVPSQLPPPQPIPYLLSTIPHFPPHIEGDLEIIALVFIAEFVKVSNCL